jgi:predicted GNAT superfamily acetyltransferase
MQIRPLTTLEDCRQVVALEKLVWGYADAEDVVPSPVLIVSIKRGGILLGAFDDRGEMKGFVYSIPGLKDGRPIQWSHMLGVTPDARAAGIGAGLKLAQRQAALDMGIDLIEWTYDPLQAMNAHLNFAKLGVVVEEYEENIYGESSSPLHRGTPTDRFVAEWHLREPHVVRRISPGGMIVRDGSVADAPVVNPSRPGEPDLRPGSSDLSFEGRRVLVEIPTGFGEMQVRDSQLALDWRMATREIFQTYFARGYRAVDFFLAREARRGHYLLSAPKTKGFKGLQGVQGGSGVQRVHGGSKGSERFKGFRKVQRVQGGSEGSGRSKGSGRFKGFREVQSSRCVGSMNDGS